MSKRIMLLLVGFTIFLFMLIAAITTAPDLVNPNNYKTNLAAIIKQKTGRDVVFKGNIYFAMFPWLGFSADNIEIENKTKFQPLPFLIVEKSEIKIKLLPLLKRRLEIDSVYLEGLILNLVRDKQGVNNWDDLFNVNSISQDEIANPKADVATQKVALLTGLAVGAVTVKNAHLMLDDKQTGRRLELKNINFDSDKVAFETPVKMTMAMAITGNLVKFPFMLKGVTGLRVDEEFNNFVFTDSLIEVIGYKKLRDGQPMVATFTIPRAIIDRAQQKLQVSGMRIQSGDVNLAIEMTGEQISAKPSFYGSSKIAPFNPKKVMQKWCIAAPAMSDDTALSKLSLNFDFHTNLEKTELSNLDFDLDNSHGKGFISVKGFDKPTFLFNLAVDTMDADRYLAPEHPSPQPNAVTLFSADKLVSSLAGLRKLDAEGELTLGKIVFNRIVMQDLRLMISSKKGMVNIHQEQKK